ncbi:MAG TPA: response regulator transcription factor [Ktedonobacterales bacterium]|jgi:two-component system, NarL family, nitrate/nitrite response regulator NarL|nr:response regulator transcription factor [Ktedonobacterales bacterium]
MSENISMVIVDDHPFFREGVATILGNQPDIDVVGQGGTAQEALDLARDLLPDVLLLDIDIPGGGLQAAQHIARTCPVVKIVMLTVSADEEHVLSAFKAGAHAYVLKGVAKQELIHILHAVYAGEGYVTPTLAASLLSEMSSASPGERAPAVSFDELTERERQILELIAQGDSNREIGQKLYLTEKTVKHYVTNLLQKLHVRNRVEAAVLAQRGVRQDQGAR